jgi:hypothetical protein
MSLMPDLLRDILAYPPEEVLLIKYRIGGAFSHFPGSHSGHPPLLAGTSGRHPCRSRRLPPLVVERWPFSSRH